ncbi:hypothetical protein LCGC14_1225410 [marine sediment metagenome]|uniref:Uncharacterized protein n=1 Tax=marine sediment metagenome TaxID=412755 RepID=A0A0F9LX90_9ZZZZ
MKKVLLVLVLTVSLLGAAWAGHYKGYGDAYIAWETRIEATKQELKIGTYHMALTNARACVLALDSALLRFISDPTAEGIKELTTRRNVCDIHWELVTKYLPEGSEEGVRILRQSKFEFSQWILQINHLTKSRVFLLTARLAGRSNQVDFLVNSIREGLKELRFYRDRIDDLLFEAWDADS